MHKFCTGWGDREECTEENCCMNEKEINDEKEIKYELHS